MTCLWLISLPGAVSHHWVGSAAESRHPRLMKLSIRPQVTGPPWVQERFVLRMASLFHKQVNAWKNLLTFQRTPNQLVSQEHHEEWCSSNNLLADWRLRTQELRHCSRTPCFLRVFPQRLACGWALVLAFPIEVHLVSIRFHNRD